MKEMPKCGARKEILDSDGKLELNERTIHSLPKASRKAASL